MKVNMDKTSYTLDENLNKATIVFEIQNFSKAWSRLRKGASFESEFSIGRTDFSFLVHPSWSGPLYPKEEMSVYLRNNSDHDVAVDYSIRAKGSGGDRASTSEYDFRMVKGTGWGAQSFMHGRKTINSIVGALKFKVVVTVKSEATDSKLSVSGLDLNEVGVEQEEVLTQQADVNLKEILDEENEMPMPMGNQLEALNSQLVGKEAKLHELWNNDRSLVEAHAKVMSELLSDIGEVEEEMAAIEKQARDKDEQHKRLLKKKKSLENFIEEKVSESKEAKDQLEKEIEDIKTKIGDLSKVGSVQPESPNLKLKWLESIEIRIEAEKKELECPVCFEVASIPIFCCDEQHLICCECRPKVIFCWPILFT